MLTALVIWGLAASTTAGAIAWAQHTHPERYTAAAVAARYDRIEAELNSEESE